MGIHYERARILFDQSRYDLAERELLNELAIEPDCAYAHSLYALCLAKRKAYDRATEEAKLGIHLAPYLAYAHVTLANVLCDLDLIDDAQTAITEAIRLQPENALYHALRAHFFVRQERWQDALAASEVGLKLDPQESGCRHNRVFALMKLKRYQEADALLDTALLENPEDSVAYATRGWALLVRKDRAKATMHFREALRLNPQDEWASVGLLSAIRSRNRLFRCVWRVFQWFGNADGLRKAAWVFLFILTIRMFNDAGKAIFDVRLLPFVAFAGFVTAAPWLMIPLQSLMLISDATVRRSLPGQNVVASVMFAICMGLAVIVAAIGVWAEKSAYYLMAFWFSAMAILFAVYSQCAHKRIRCAVGLYAIVLAIVGAAACWTYARGLPEFRMLGPIFVLAPYFTGQVANLFTPEIEATAR